MILLAGIATLLYPSTATGFSDKFHVADVAAYTREVDALPDSDRLEMIEDAQAYNDHLPNGPLRTRTCSMSKAAPTA